MILKGNMLKLTIPFFWAVQSIWLLSFKSIETFIAAIILLLISFLGIVIKSNTYNIIFLGICFLYSVALGLIMFLLFLFFELPMICLLYTSPSPRDIYIGPYYEFYSFGIYVKEVWTKVTK